MLEAWRQTNPVCTMSRGGVLGPPAPGRDVLEMRAGWGTYGKAIVSCKEVRPAQALGQSVSRVRQPAETHVSNHPHARAAQSVRFGRPALQHAPAPRTKIMSSLQDACQISGPAQAPRGPNVRCPRSRVFRMQRLQVYAGIQHVACRHGHPGNQRQPARCC